MPTGLAQLVNARGSPLIHSEPVGQLDDVLRGQVHHAVMPAGQCIAEGAHRVRRRLAAPSSEAVHEHAVNT